MNLQAESSSLKKGESLLDTVRTLDAMKPDCIVMRHSSSGAPDFVARHLPLPVINAGDGTHEHPTQALLDALTIRDRRGTLEGLNVTILGDILHSRVARSNIHLLGEIRLPLHSVRARDVGPAGIRMPGSRGDFDPARHAHRGGLEDADVVMTLRVQQERLHEPALAVDEYILQYQLTPERLRLREPDALVLHPGPMIRGLEIDPAVADGPQSCVLEQVTNGLAVRMALLFLMIGAGTNPKRNLPMLLIKNGRVLDPASGTDAPRDVLLDGDRIAAVAPHGPACGSRATGRGNFRCQRI